MVDNKGMLTFGAMAGAVVYGLQLLLAKVARQSLIQLGSAQEVGQKLLGLTGFDFMTLVYFVIGGAVLVLLSSYIMQYIPMMPNSKIGKAAVLLVVAAVISSLILSGTLGVSISAIIPLAINAVVSAFVIVTVMEAMKMKVPL